MIERFITYKEPHPIADEFDAVGSLLRKGGMLFRSHVVMANGENFLISDAQHGSGYASVDETLVFRCDEEGNITSWDEVIGGASQRTDEIVHRLNTESLESLP